MIEAATKAALGPDGWLRTGDLGQLVDGELLAWRHGEAEPAPFALLQKRIGRTKLSKAILAEAPVRLLAYDLLELDGQDIEAVHVMSEALDKLCLCGAEAEVGDLRRWMSQKDNSGMLKLALSRCFPPFLVDDIVRGDMLSPLERKRHSRRQDITVLFTDIRDFTVISQTMAPDELLAMLSDWFPATTGEIIHVDGGYHAMGA